MTTITVSSPRPVASPRGAVFAAWAFQRISDALTGWQTARLARADRRNVARLLADATSVRRYAQSVAQYDPRFAADLLAAADRHEAAAK